MCLYPFKTENEVGLKYLFAINFFISLNCNGQYIRPDRLSTSFDTLKLQTEYIMKVLGISIRNNLILDDTIKISVDSNLNKFDAFFIKDNNQTYFPYLDSVTLDTAGRFYKGEKLLISKLVFRIVFNNLDTLDRIKITAAQTIVHELVHYFQALVRTGPRISGNTINDYFKEISQPIEFEAYAVGAYFMLYMVDKNQLKYILAQRVTKTERFKLLIYAFLKIPDFN